MSNEVCSSEISNSGKSSADIVEKSAWKPFDATVSLPPERLKLNSSLSGRDLHSSDIFLAETVVSPSSSVETTSELA